MRRLALGLLVSSLLAGCGDLVERALAREGDPAAGAEVFAEACATCHGADGTGTEEGPDLTDDDDTREELVEKLVDGWGEMESFEGVLSAQEIADVVAYVQEVVQDG